MERENLVKNTLDQIPQSNPDAKRIVGLVKEGGRITGYQLSDNSIVEKQQAVNMAKKARLPTLESPTVVTPNTSNPSPTATKTTI